MSPAGNPPLVLAYHTVNDVSRDHDPGGLVVPPTRFRTQVESLVRRGYEFVTVGDFADRLRASGPPQGVCALTFDDGSDDAVLFDVLEKLGVPATVFVCPGLLGEPHPWLRPESGIRLFSAETLLDVSGLPFVEVGSHTNTHTSLAAATEIEAYEELLSSRLALEELIGGEVTSVAYPFGVYSPACPAAAERAGFRCAATLGGLGGWRPLELRREGIRRWDRGLSFALKSLGLGHAVLRSRAAGLAFRARNVAVRRRRADM